MKYPDGVDIRLGDRIWWDEGVAIGYVWMIVESPEECSAVGQTEPCVMVSLARDHGPRVPVICEPQRFLADEGIGLLSDAETGLVERVLSVAAARLHCPGSVLGLSCSYAAGERTAWTVVRYGSEGIVAVLRASPSLDEVREIGADELSTFLRPIAGGGPL